VQTHQEIIWKKRKKKIRAEDSGLLGRDTAMLWEWFSTFWRKCIAVIQWPGGPLHLWQWRQYVLSKCGNHNHMSSDV